MEKQAVMCEKCKEKDTCEVFKRNLALFRCPKKDMGTEVIEKIEKFK